jgi:hypothetical protein
MLATIYGHVGIQDRRRTNSSGPFQAAHYTTASVGWLSPKIEPMVRVQLRG